MGTMTMFGLLPDLQGWKAELELLCSSSELLEEAS